MPKGIGGEPDISKNKSRVLRVKMSVEGSFLSAAAAFQCSALGCFGGVLEQLECSALGCFGGATGVGDQL